MTEVVGDLGLGGVMWEGWERGKLRCPIGFRVSGHVCFRVSGLATLVYILLF